jgi:hypothetical protein
MLQRFGSKGRALFAAAFVCALGVVGVGYAFGAIGSGGTIQGCYDSGGNLKVVATGSSCPKTYTALSWNQQGPAGATGASGAVGATGPSGPQGASGPSGAQGSSGPTGATGPRGPSNLAPTKAFTPMQLIESGILTCEATDNTDTRNTYCMTPRLNGLGVNGDFLEGFHICIVISGNPGPTVGITHTPIAPGTQHFEWTPTETGWTISSGASDQIATLQCGV